MAEAAEVLEVRTVLAASTLDVEMDGAVLILTGNADPDRPDSNEAVIVRTGFSPNYTDVYLGGAFLRRLNQVPTSIIFDGLSGDDSLAFFGKDPDLTIELTDVEKLELNSRNTIVLSNDSLLIGGATVVGTLDVSTSAGDITQTGRISVSGTTTLSANAGDGDITLTANGNAFGTLQLTGATVTIFEAAPTDLGASTVGELTIRSGAAITDSDQIVVSGHVSLTANNNSITLDQETSTFGGTLTLRGTNITVTDSDDTGTDLGTVTAKGTLSITSASDITHSEGQISVTGRATFTANNGTADITLAEGDNNFGSVSLFGADVRITEKSATDLFETAVTNLNVISAGAITDSGTIAVAETATLTANGRPITLDDSDSTYSGVLTLTGGKVSVRNNTATILGAVVTSGTFNLLSSGDVTQLDNTTNAVGRTTITATDFDITLGEGSRFGSLSLFGHNVTIDEINATNLFTSTISGNFNLSTNGAVTDSGTISILGTSTINAGTGAITLDSANSAFEDTITLIGSNVTLVNDTVTDFGPTTATRNLRVLSSGSVTQSGALRVTGRATFSAAGQDITLTDDDNEFGSIALIGNEVAIAERNSTNLFTSNVTGSLAVTSGGTITDSGFLLVAGLAEFRAVAQITLDAASSTFGGSLVLVGLAIKVHSAASLDLGFVQAVGTLTITSGHNISDSNPTGIAAPDPVLSATGAVIIHADGSLILDEIRSFTSANVNLLGEAGTSV